MAKSFQKSYQNRSLTCCMTQLGSNYLFKDDLEGTEKIYTLTLDLKKFRSANSVRQLHGKLLEAPFSITPREFQEFFEKVYKPRIEQEILKHEQEKNRCYACNAVGHGVIYFVCLMEPKNKVLQKLIRSFKIFFLTLTKIPFPIQYDQPRFYFFTVQNQFYPFFTPSSESLDEKDDWNSGLSSYQKHLLKSIHEQRKIDKNSYTGTYGVYFQLVYEPLRWFGPYRKNFCKKGSILNQSRYIFDAEILLSKITKQMDKYFISEERKKEFIFMNPGWFFGKKESSTIEYDDNFLLHCYAAMRKNNTSYLEGRNEVVIRWIIPVDLEHGCVWISDPPPYASTYF